ncbi:MAG: hypothetical protein II342_00715, partial [Clostridia bacterium]|nr:hypothetical protein [Clostridia bacterium]
MARHPIMRADSLKSLRIPDLMGGLNLRDSVNMINDNQLTECFNMWWADGALKTRPAVEGKIITNVKKPMSEHELKGRTEEIRRHNCTKEENGRKAQLCSVKSVFDFSHTTIENAPVIDEEGNETDTKTEVEIKKSEFKTVINFFWCFGADNKVLVPLEITATQALGSYFAVWHNDTIYCFTSNKQIWKYEENLNEWTEVKEEDRVDEDGEIISSRIYVPLVAVYCKTNGSVIMPVDEVLASGVQYEGYNLLSNYYKIQYEGFNYEVATGTEGGKSHRMTYFLLDYITRDKYAGMPLTVKLTRGG